MTPQEKFIPYNAKTNELAHRLMFSAGLALVNSIDGTELLKRIEELITEYKNKEHRA